MQKLNYFFTVSRFHAFLFYVVVYLIRLRHIEYGSYPVTDLPMIELEPLFARVTFTAWNYSSTVTVMLMNFNAFIKNNSRHYSVICNESKILFGVIFIHISRQPATLEPVTKVIFNFFSMIVITSTVRQTYLFFHERYTFRNHILISCEFSAVIYLLENRIFRQRNN